MMTRESLLFNEAIEALPRADYRLFAADVECIILEEGMTADLAWETLGRRIGGASGVQPYLACLRVSARKARTIAQSERGAL